MPRPTRAIATTILLATLAACGGGAPPGALGPEPLAPLADADRLYYDNGEGITDSVRIVVRDQGALVDVWSRATSRQTSPAPAPAVDFGSDMVVVAGAGRMTPEDRIRVDSVGVREVTDAVGDGEDVMLVVVRTTEGCRRFNVDAYPVEIVRVPRFDGAVRFIERRETDQSCPPQESPSP